MLPTRDVAALSWRDHGIVYAAEGEDMLAHPITARVRIERYR